MTTTDATYNYPQGNKHVEIDLPTGLPKLSIELLPDIEPEEYGSSHRKHLYVHPTDVAGKLPRNNSTALTRDFDNPTHMDLRHSSSSPECRQRSYSGASAFNRHSKQRSSLYIKLHRTPTAPHRLRPLTETETGTNTAPCSDADSQFNFPDGTGPGSGQGSADGSSPMSASSSTPDLMAKTPGDATPPLPPPSPVAKRRLTSTGRRNSFLYESDGNSTPLLHNHSSSNMEETFVTPFAQILATMHRVRQSFISLMGLPDDCNHSHGPLTPGPSMTHRKLPPTPRNRKLSLDACRQQAINTLQHIDWCLHQLESVDSAKAMGGALAQDKFHRLLTRELSHMSEHSKSGNKLAEWVHDITGSTNERHLQVDRALSQETSGINSDEVSMHQRLSGSMSHDEWRRKTITRSNTGTQIHIKLQEGCERVPTFGVTDPKMNVTKMREFMAEEVEKWSPDVFYLDEISAGNSLVCAAYNIFKTRELWGTFKVSPPTFVNFVLAVQNRYHKLNPYHNHMHAADVMLTTDFLLKAKPIENIFSKLEVFAALVAAAVHDVDHPGRSNHFLIETSDDLAVLYNDNSVLENHHLAVAFKIMAEPGCNFLEHLDKEQIKAFRRMVIDMVLATDMSVHFQHLAELKTLLETKKLTNDGILELDNYKERSELLQCLIHCSDLSNPAKEENLAVNWSNRIMQETFKQGDEERRRGIPMNPLGDREQVSIAKCQVTFIDLIVYPLFETWSELVYPEAQHILDNLSSTRQYWVCRVTNSPPPTIPGSPTSTSTPSNCTNTHPLDDAVNHAGLARVNETCEMAEPEAEVTSRNPEFVNSPAADRRNSYKSYRGDVIDEER